jgi:hypothetical protein
MMVTWEYDGPEWRALKEIRELMRGSGPQGEALAAALHSVMQEDLERAAEYINAARLGIDEYVTAALADLDA